MRDLLKFHCSFWISWSLALGIFLTSLDWAQEDSFQWMLQEVQKKEGGRIVRNRTIKFELEKIGEELENMMIQLRKTGLQRNAELLDEVLDPEFFGNFYLNDKEKYDKVALKTHIHSFFQQFTDIREAFWKVRLYHQNEAWETKALIQIKVDFRGTLKTGELYSTLASWWVIVTRPEKGSRWKIWRSVLNTWVDGKEANPAFKSVTQSAGLKLFSPPAEELINVVISRKRHESEATHFEYGGIAAGDFNNDHFPDLFIPNAYGRDLLYRNNQDGTFTEVGISVFTDTNAASRAAVFGDIDNDGDQDLFVARSSFPMGRVEPLHRSGNAFFLNENGTFVDRTKEAGLAFVGHSFSSVFFDFDNDGDLDLYVANYANKDTLEDSLDARNGEANLLYENLGNGTFREIGAKAGVNSQGWSFATAVCDYDFDGDMDIYVANDFGINNFYENQGDGTFKDVAPERGVEDRGYGMGSVFVDFNQDSAWDLYVSNMFSNTGKRVLQTQAGLDPKEYEMLTIFTRGNSMFQGIAGQKSFKYVSPELGVHMCGWAWHSDFFDYDADGDEDLLVVNGYITGNSEKDY